MADKGKISYAVGLEHDKLRSDAAESKRILHGIGTTAVEEGQKMDDAFKRVGTAIAGAMSLAAITAFGKKIISVRAEVQSLEISFRTLMGSAPKAEAFMAELREFAVRTPMMLKDLASGAQTMLSFGIASEEVMPILKAIGDISMGDAQKFQSLTLAFSQATSAGKLMGQDLLQMINAGFNPLATIAEKTGKTIGELKEEMSKGAISADMLKQAFIDATSEGGKFHGMLEEQSKGLNGAISNFQGAIDDMYNDIGEKLEKPFVDAVAIATDIVKHYEEIAKVLGVVIAAYGTYKAALIAVAMTHKLVAIWGQVQAFLSLARGITSAKDAMLLFNMVVKANPIGLLLGAIAAAAAAFSLFGDSADETAEALKREQEEAEQFEKRVSAAAGRAQAQYKKLQKSYKECRNEHEKTQWIKNNQQQFKLLGISVGNVNTAENIFVKNTEMMMEALKKRAQAAAYETKIEELYIKKNEREDFYDRQKVHEGQLLPADAVGTDNGNRKVVGNRLAWTAQGAAAENARIESLKRYDDKLRDLNDEIDKTVAKITILESESSEMLTKAGTTTTTTGKDDDTPVNTEKDKQNKIEQLRKKAQEQLLQMQRDNTEQSIELMDEGNEKEIKRIEHAYDVKKAELEKQAAEWKEINKNTGVGFELTDEQQAAIEEGYNNAAAARNEALARIKKEESEAMLDYLSVYGDFEERRKAVTEKANKEIASATTEGEKKTIQKKLQEALSEIDLDQLKEKTDWTKVFGNVDEVSKETLQNLKEQLLEFIKNSKTLGVEAKKDLVEAITSIDEEVAKRQPFKQLGESLDNLQDATRECREAQEAYNKAVKEGTTAEQENAKATLNAARDAKRKAQIEATRALHNSVNEAQDYVEMAGSLTNLLEAFGANPPQWINDFISGMDEMLHGLESIDMTKPVTAITGSIDALAGLTKATFSIGGLIDFNNSNAKEVQRTIERLTERNENLQYSIERLTETIEESYGAKSVEAYKEAVKKQEEMNQNLLEMAKAKAGYHGSHHSWNHYWGGFTDEEMEWIRKNVNKDFNGDLFSLSPEEMAKLKENYEIWKRIQETGKGDYGKHMTEELDKYIEQEGKIEELQQKLYEGLTGMTFDGMFDSFIDCLTDMKYSAEDAADDISEYFFKAMLRNQIGELYAEKLKGWWEKFGEMMTNGTLEDEYMDGKTEGEWLTDEYLQYLEEAQKIRDELAKITGWDEIQNGDEERQASQKGIATASQETVDELNGRATAIQGHTYSIMENTKLLVANTNEILRSVMNIDRNTEGIATRIDRMEGSIRDIRNDINDIALKGVRMK